MNKIIYKGILLCILSFTLQGCLMITPRTRDCDSRHYWILTDKAKRQNFSLPPNEILKNGVFVDEFDSTNIDRGFYHEKSAWVHIVISYRCETMADLGYVKFNCERFTFNFGCFARRLISEEGYFRRYRGADPILSQETDYRELGDIVCVSYKFDYSAKKFSNVKALKLALVRNEIKEVPVDITPHEALKIIEDIRAYNRPRIAAYIKERITKLNERKPKQ